MEAILKVWTIAGPVLGFALGAFLPTFFRPYFFPPTVTMSLLAQAQDTNQETARFIIAVDPAGEIRITAVKSLHPEIVSLVDNTGERHSKYEPQGPCESLHMTFTRIPDKRPEAVHAMVRVRLEIINRPFLTRWVKPYPTTRTV
ncbi:hypothetical protein [Glycocaulis sp.]|uniref:hypothetical protein n=1 Tax=Glycocaulis sp. TaxID=1969725 RepID=UPI003D1DF552